MFNLLVGLSEASVSTNLVSYPCERFEPRNVVLNPLVGVSEASVSTNLVTTSCKKLKLEELDKNSTSTYSKESMA